MPVSFLVLTFNEEFNIERCLRSIAWSDDIVVVDSGSTDNTVEIATEFGATVINRAFDNFADQRNFGIDNCFSGDNWIFHIDADECVTEELAEELKLISQSDSDKVFRVASRIYFKNKWIRRSSMYPWYQVRFGRRNHLRFKMVGHGQRETVAAVEVDTLKFDLDHYSFSKGIDDWIEKHNRYSTDEALQVNSDRKIPIRWYNLSSNDKTVRHRELKRLSNRIPFRPGIRFLYNYVICRGFIDGRAGYEYAKMMAMYQAMIDLKIERE